MKGAHNHAWASEAARSRAVFACQQAAELREQARHIVWSCERECDFAQRLVDEAVALRRRSAPEKG